MARQVYTESDPLRPPDWRHRTACYLAEHRIHPAWGRYDPWVRGLANYLASRTTPCDADIVASAHRIFTDGFRLRFAVEAGLLGGCDPEQLAGLLGLHELVVTAYEHLWFDVRTRLDARAFIITEVIGAARKSSDQWCDYGWKTECYMGGKDAFINLFSPGSHDTAQRILETKQSVELMLARRVHDAIEDTSIDSSKELVALLRRGGRSGKQERLYTDYEKNIDEMLRQIPMEPASRMSPDNPLYRFKNCAAELSADETLRVARGETLPNEEEILNLTFETMRPQQASEATEAPPPASNKLTRPSPPLEVDPFH